MKNQSIPRTLLGFIACLLSAATMATPYEREPGPIATPPSSATRAFTNTTTFMQVCTMGVSVENCVNLGSLGVRYVGSTAFSTLTSLGCVYKYSRSLPTTKPALDFYSCSPNGETVIVFLDGPFANSFAGAISVLN